MAYVDSAPLRDSAPTKGKDSKSPSARLNRYWKEIEAYGKSSSDWKEQGEKIVRMYLDQHRTAATARRFALLWSNIETLKPAIYAKTPTVLCSRRYKDPHPVGRVAAELLERATNTTFDLYDVDEVFRMVRDDRLLVARGQAWVRYEASFKTAKDDKGGEYEKVSGEKACVDYVHWCDFGHNVAGTWKDVWLAWRKVYKTKDEATERFGAKVAGQLTYAGKVDPDGKEEKGEHVACIFEVWDKKKRQIAFMSRDYPDFLEEPAEPPLSFRDFFPCPEPCYGSKTGKSLIPTPDYRYYQDQAMEIDDLTEKIANLTDYLIVRGFVPAGPSADGADAVRVMIQNLQEGISRNKSTFIPVESWAGFTEKGGAGRLIDWLPIDIIVKALQMAVETRNQLVQDVYQITGISDILRGQTDPDETLGAQEIKSQTGSRRIKNAKDELARFCKDIGQLVAEVIAEQFQPQTIAEMTGYAYEPMTPPVDPAQAQMPSPSMQPQMPGAPPAQPPMALPPGASGAPSPSRQTFNDEVIALLRNDRMRGFLIDIETDSTVQPDEDAEKQRRVEFVTAIGGFMREAIPAAQQTPAIVPVLGETLMFLARGFRAGRALEETFERAMQQLQQQAMQPQPNPEQIKAEAEARRILLQSQADREEAERKRVEGEQEMARKEREGQLKAAQTEMEFSFRERELKLKERELELKTNAMENQQRHQAILNAQELQHATAMAQIEKSDRTDKARRDREKDENDERRAEDEHKTKKAEAAKPKVTKVNRDGEGRMSELVTQ